MATITVTTGIMAGIITVGITVIGTAKIVLMRPGVAGQSNLCRSDRLSRQLISRGRQRLKGLPPRWSSVPHFGLRFQPFALVMAGAAIAALLVFSARRLASVTKVVSRRASAALAAASTLRRGCNRSLKPLSTTVVQFPT